tara:strand:- start:2739 stop:4448 length:1710 start_codon:yes stop_codon:yes gene_type:complete
MEDKKVTGVLKRLEGEENNRGSYEEHWEDLAAVMLTRRQGFRSQQEPGDKRTDDIFDGTPMQGARSLANTVGSMLRPEGEVLAKVSTEDKRIMDDGEASEWLADATARLDAGMRNPAARFRQATGEIDLDLVVLGTGVMFVGLSNTKQHLIFKSLHLKDTFPIFDAEGRVVGVMSRHMWTIWQAAGLFGLENLHPETQKKYKEGKMDEMLRFVHAVIPRDQAQNGLGRFAKNMPFADIWIQRDKAHTVQEGGYEELPYIAPRWDTSSGENYGRSPGMIALPDANTLQAMGETILISGQRAADPPLMAPDDGFYNELNTFPGGMSYYDVETAIAMGGNPIFSLENGTNLPITRDMQDDTRNQVMNAFFRNILNLPVNGPQMTATEINQRKEEFIREVGAVFGRFETDYNLPMTERAFNVMLRNNGFAPVPKSLENQTLKMEFELPVTKIRKQIEAAAAEQWAISVANLAVIDPTVTQMIDAPELARFMHGASALPHEIIVSKDVFEERIKKQQEAQAKADQMAQMEMLSKAAQQGGSAAASFSKAKAEGGLEGEEGAEGAGFEQLAELAA